MAIKHGRKNSKPNKSQPQAQQQQMAGQAEPNAMFSQPPGVPDIDAPGMMLDHGQVPGAGFAPH